MHAGLVALRTLALALAVRIPIALAIVAAFWGVGSLLDHVFQRVARLRALDPDLTRFVGRVVRVVLVVFGIVTALGTVGVDVKALVAGLGLTGFALGFALKDIISNSLAGVLILVFRPFRHGDHVEVAGAAGTIEGIDLRYTVLAGDDHTRVLVPNATLFTNNIRVTPGGKRKPAPPPPPAEPAR